MSKLTALVTARSRLANASIKKIRKEYPLIAPLLSKESTLETLKTAERQSIVTRDGVPILFTEGESYIPTVRCIHMIPELLKRAVVNKGAIKPIISGARVMAPGLITESSSIPEMEKGEIISVYSEGKQSALAVGRALMSKEEIERIRTGVAVEIVSVIGDTLYMH
jgi:malignant T-cell-amplified sequence